MFIANCLEKSNLVLTLFICISDFGLTFIYIFLTLECSGTEEVI